MKKVLLGFIFCLSISAGAQTSVYHPFPDSSAVWIVSSGCCNQAIGCGVVCCNLMTRFEMTGDTVINSLSYHKILSFGTWSCNLPCAGPCMQPNWGMNYIREDTAKKIWWLYPFTMTDTLLYDFNLTAGDTIHTMPSYVDTNIVQSVDSILIGSDYRKIYYYNSSSYGPDTCTHFLIEGIGSGAGLFSELCGSCFEHGYRLECFKQDNQILYYPNNIFCQNDTGTVCNFTVSVSEVKSEKYIVISPNPATTQLAISSRQGTIKEIEIYDVLGEKVHLEQLSISNYQLTVNVSELHSGIYFVILRGEKSSAAGKPACHNCSSWVAGRFVKE